MANDTPDGRRPPNDPNRHQQTLLDREIGGRGGWLMKCQCASMDCNTHRLLRDRDQLKDVQGVPSARGLGWVDLNCEFYTVCLILSGRMGIWQTHLGCSARGWNPTQPTSKSGWDTLCKYVDNSVGSTLKKPPRYKSRKCWHRIDRKIGHHLASVHPM